MNETIKTLLERRSCKSYLPKQVEEDALQQILTAGTYAANGMARQAPKILVLQDPEKIAKLERLNASFMGNPDLKPFYGAPTVCCRSLRPHRCGGWQPGHRQYDGRRLVFGCRLLLDPPWQGGSRQRRGQGPPEGMGHRGRMDRRGTLHFGLCRQTLPGSSPPKRGLYYEIVKSDKKGLRFSEKSVYYKWKHRTLYIGGKEDEE